MVEFQKIELSSASRRDDVTSNENVQGKVKKNRINKPIVVFILIFILLLGGFAIVIIPPAQKVYSSAAKTYKQAQKTMDAVKKQNIALASTELDKTKQSLKETQGNLSSLSFLRFIPILNGYYNDADHMVKAGFYGLEASTVLVESIKPYADILGLKGQGSFVMGSAEQRIQTAIMTMGKITPRIDDITKYLASARKEFDKVDPNHYPPFLGGEKIKKQLISVRDSLDQGVTFAEEARPLIKILPALLGESKEKKYLVLFQNDKELRPTGGFITAYAVFRIDKGVIHIDSSSDIYNLDNTLRVRKSVPEAIAKYLPKVNTFNLRDSNISADFVESMKTFNSLYQYTSNKADVDGIIALDTNVLVSTIKILDDEVYASGIKFTSQKDKRCDCPQVIYQLESLISTPKSLDLRVTSLASVQAQRKDILGSLLYSIMSKALKSSPKLYWGPLFQDLVEQTNQKHILFYMYNKDAQSGIEALNAAGRIKSFDGDYLHINEANFGGAKSNMFVKESVMQSIDVGSDGVITKTVTITYKNPYPPSDCNLERGALCLNATLRDWVRIYVPKGSKLVDSQGSEVKVTSYEELGKTVFDGFITVRPLGSATYTVKYTLPFKVASNSPLPILIQKQPGTFDNEYIIKVKGKQVRKFNLITDREMKLAL